MQRALRLHLPAAVPPLRAVVLVGAGDPVEVLQGLNLGGPQIFMNVDIVNDQQLAGIVMKVSQEFIYGGVLAALFYQWYNSENRGIDPLPSSQQTITPERG